MIRSQYHYNERVGIRDLSIVIVSWNTKEFLKQCLESIYNKIREATFDVYVIDNASTDGSPEMVQKEFPQVNLVCTGSNLGFAKANNIGIMKSSSRYICILNPDVILKENCIDTICGYMNHHPSVGLLGPKILNLDLTLQPSCRGIPTLWNTLCRALGLDEMFPSSKLFGSYLMRFWPHDTNRIVDAIVGCYWMVRRKALETVGLLDENYFLYMEDIDWCKRFRNAGWEVIYFSDAEALHYGSASSSNLPIECYIEMKRSTLLYWKKYHGRFGTLYIFLITLLHEIIRIIRGMILYLIKPRNRRKYGYKIKRSTACIGWLFRFSSSKKSQHRNFSVMR